MGLTQPVGPLELGLDYLELEHTRTETSIPSRPKLSSVNVPGDYLSPLFPSPDRPSPPASAK